MLETKLTLRAWIIKTGPEDVAKKLKVNSSTVRHWKRGHCLPRAWQMRAIKKLSKGLVTYDTMIDSYFDRVRK